MLFLLFSFAFCLFASAQTTFIKYTNCGEHTCNIKQAVLNSAGNITLLRVYRVKPHNYMYLTEIDHEGIILKNAFITEPQNEELIFHTFLQAKDGGYLLAGNFHPDVVDGSACIMKLDASFNFQWAKSFSCDGITPQEFGMIVFE